MTTFVSVRFPRSLAIGALAGFAGGTAEIIWVGLYAAVAGISATAVAQGVTTAVLPVDGATAAALWGGIVIHMALAVALGAALGSAFRAVPLPFSGPWVQSSAVVAVLVAVWAVNFLVVLPWLSPAFVDLLPYPVSFTSKLLFGLTAAAVLGAGGDRERSHG